MQADEDRSSEELMLHLLDRRARALAIPLSEEDEAHHLEVIVVRCGYERYGLETAWVHEVQPATHVTAVPGAPPEWAGLMNLRGIIYPVLNAARYLALEEDPSPAPQVVLLGSARGTVGFLVDDVFGLDRFPADDVHPPLDAAPSRPGLVRGVTPGMVPMLDVEIILNDPLFLNHTREDRE